MSVNIRKGEREDLPVVLALIKELAIYERAEDQVANTVAQLEADGFGTQPAYGLLVAELDQKVVGMALYYIRYSTWKGKRIYLEDLVVTETCRGKGIGKALFEATQDAGRDLACTGMMWQVLDWNEPAIRFYKSYHAYFEGEWLNGHLDFE